MGAPNFASFSINAKEFLGDSKVLLMTAEEFGAYFMLLLVAWQEDPVATLPDDEETLARWARLSPSRWKECREKILSCFEKTEDGRLVHKALRKEYERILERHRVRSDSGTKGAMHRWQKNGSCMANAWRCHDNTNGTASPNGEPVRNEEKHSKNGSQRQENGHADGNAMRLPCVCHACNSCRATDGPAHGTPDGEKTQEKPCFFCADAGGGDGWQCHAFAMQLPCGAYIYIYISNLDELISKSKTQKEGLGGTGGRGGAGGKDGAGGDKGFDAFWSSYPRRENKQSALKAWKKLNPDNSLQSVILKAVEMHKRSSQWARGIIPHASTWINQKRWEDELGECHGEGKLFPDMGSPARIGTPRESIEAAKSKTIRVDASCT